MRIRGGRHTAARMMPFNPHQPVHFTVTAPSLGPFEAPIHPSAVEQAFGGVPFEFSSPKTSPTIASMQMRGNASPFLTPLGSPDLHASLHLSRDFDAIRSPINSSTQTPPGHISPRDVTPDAGDEISSILNALSLGTAAG